MKSLFVTICGLLMVAWPGSGHASWQRFTNADGLAGSGVLSILPASSGDLWFGTAGGGAVRSDGVSWIPYGSEADLAAATVFAMTEDASGSIWFGTDRGVRRFNGQAWDRFDDNAGLPADAVNALLQDSSGNLWAGYAAQGVARFDGATWTRFTTGDGLPDDRVHAILEAADGSIWVATDGGAARFDGATWTTLTTADGLPGNAVRAMAQDPAGVLWFATGSGVGRLDSGGTTALTVSDGLVSNDVLAALVDGSGAVWFGTGFGVSRYADGEFTNTTEAQGLASNRVETLVEDGRGILWAASPTSITGISRFDGRFWRAVTSADGLGSQNAATITEDESGNVWFGTTFPTPGATRHDGEAWTSVTAADGLAQDLVSDILEDGQGRLWVGSSAGVTLFEGTSSRILTQADGLAGNQIADLTEDRDGAVWIATGSGVSRYRDGLIDSFLPGVPVRRTFQAGDGSFWFGTAQGAEHFDGTLWTGFTTVDGLAGDDVRGVAQEANGAVWFATTNGVSRYDGGAFTTYRRTDGLVNNFVNAVLVDTGGAAWFGTDNGIGRFDGTWTSILDAPGLASVSVHSMIQARDGRLWFATSAGVSRYDGSGWISFGQPDGLVGPLASAVTEDAAGAIWIGTAFGASRFEPDRVPPCTVFPAGFSRLSPDPDPRISFAAQWGETQGIRFSWSFDGEPWSPWASTTYWEGNGLPDGPHALRVQARDLSGNVESPPALAEFEIDATAPQPVITAPVFRQALAGTVTVSGTTADPRFVRSLVDVRPSGTPGWDDPSVVLLASSSVPVVNGPLATWDTRTQPDGEYELRASVLDSLGLTGVALVTVVVVDNQAPFADRTSPLRVRAELGGDVYTTNREAHLYIPPHGLSEDATVAIDPASEGDVPDTVAGGATSAGVGFRLSWETAALAKPGVLDLLIPAGIETGPLAVYHDDPASGWSRIGGTVDSGSRLVSTAIREPGLYALFRDGTSPSIPGRATSIALTPRVFSPRGGFASTEVSISFSLTGEAPVSVRVYNRAGRLVRTLAEGRTLPAGENLIRWDGRDDGGTVVDDGLYLVTVETRKRTDQLSVAVVH